MIFWVLILAGAGIILWMVFALPDFDITTGTLASVLFLAASQVVLWKKIQSYE